MRAIGADAQTVIDRSRVNDWRHFKAEQRRELLKVRRPPFGDCGRADGVLEDQVPADDPRKQLTKSCVRVGIGRARDRYHRRELRVTKRREYAYYSRQHDREHERWPSPVVSSHA